MDKKISDVTHLGFTRRYAARSLEVYTLRPDEETMPVHQFFHHLAFLLPQCDALVFTSVQRTGLFERMVRDDVGAIVEKVTAVTDVVNYSSDGRTYTMPFETTLNSHQINGQEINTRA